MWCEENLCIIRKVAISNERKCEVPGVPHLLYKEKVVKCDERVYIIRRATSVAVEPGLGCEEKVCSIRNVTSAV